MHGEASDGDLLRAMQRGEAGAFEALFARHRRGVRVYVQAITRDAGLAEDVTQEAFLELARRAGELSPRKGVAGWLYRVARNRAIDLQRHRRFEALPGDAAVVLASEARGQAPAAADVAAANEDARALRAALEGLPEGEREVLVLRYFSGLAFREIATAVGRPLGTVLWQAQRGLGRMKQAVTSDR